MQNPCLRYDIYQYLTKLLPKMEHIISSHSLSLNENIYLFMSRNSFDYPFHHALLVSYYVLLHNDPHPDLGVKHHPHDQLHHDQTPQHGFPSDHGVENHPHVQLQHGHQPQNCPHAHTIPTPCPISPWSSTSQWSPPSPWYSTPSLHNSYLLLSNLGPKARPETRTKNSKTRNPKKTENPRTVQTLGSIE